MVESINTWTVLKACAVIALAVGLFLALGAALGSNRTDAFSLAAGNWTYHFETVTLLDGKVSGTFEVTLGNNVTLLVFNQTEYDGYLLEGLATPLYEVSGSSGSFSASQGGIGKLFIVFEHDVDSDFVLTNGTMDYRITGITVRYFIIGLVLIAASPLLWQMGVLAKRKKIQERPTRSSGRRGDSEPPRK